jgi:hypothetical protein
MERGGRGDQPPSSRSRATSLTRRDKLARSRYSEVKLAAADTYSTPLGAGSSAITERRRGCLRIGQGHGRDPPPAFAKASAWQAGGWLQGTEDNEKTKPRSGEPLQSSFPWFLSVYGIRQSALAAP